MSTTSPATTGKARSFVLPSGPVLVGIEYAVCVLGLIAVFVGQILFTDVDPHESQGPIESIIGVGVAGTLALVVGLVITLALRRSPEQARVGAVVLGVMSVLSLVVFWSGAPGVLGACAAWLGGLTRGSHPQSGAARVAGVVGAFVALLDIVLNVGGVVLSGVMGS